MKINRLLVDPMGSICENDIEYRDESFACLFEREVNVLLCILKGILTPLRLN